MRTVHKVIILVCTIAFVQTVIAYFMGAEINKWVLLTAAIVIVHNLRELQFEDMKDLLESSRTSSAILFEAVRREFGPDGQLRVKNRGLDIIAERAPEEIREEALKMTEIIKKINNKEVH